MKGAKTRIPPSRSMNTDLSPSGMKPKRSAARRQSSTVGEGASENLQPAAVAILSELFKVFGQVVDSA